VKALFYRILTVLARTIGDWAFLMIAWFVATGYFLFFPHRVSVSRRFYEALFPERGWFHALGCAWRQYHSFVHVFLDRLRLARGEDLDMTCEGWEHIANAAESGKGAVLVMSHLGSWEIAATLLMKSGREIPGLKLLLFLGEKHREEIEALQKKQVVSQGVRVVVVPEEGGSSLHIIEGLHCLREGGIVSLTGDRLWGQDQQRTVEVCFAGGRAQLPEMPYVLAMLSGAPLLVFFGYRRGKEGYHLVAKPALAIASVQRLERGRAIQETAQVYAGWLEETARCHPGEWFNFTHFLKDLKNKD